MPERRIGVKPKKYANLFSIIIFFGFFLYAMAYRFAHPAKTETQLFLSLWGIILVMIGILFFWLIMSYRDKP